VVRWGDLVPDCGQDGEAVRRQTFARWHAWTARILFHVKLGAAEWLPRHAELELPGCASTATFPSSFVPDP
jgi:hypothetical protein